MKLETAKKLKFGDKVVVKRGSCSHLAGKVVEIFNSEIFGKFTNQFKDGFVFYNAYNYIDVILQGTEARVDDLDNWDSIKISDLKLIKEKINVFV